MKNSKNGKRINFMNHNFVDQICVDFIDHTIPWVLF